MTIMHNILTTITNNIIMAGLNKVINSSYII